MENNNGRFLKTSAVLGDLNEASIKESAHSQSMLPIGIERDLRKSQAQHKGISNRPWMYKSMSSNKLKRSP